METSSARRRVPAARQLGAVVTRWSLYSLFLLVPLTFLPWTTNVLEVNKQAVLVVLTAVALLAWLGGMVSERQVSLRTGLLNLFPGLFLVAVFLSSLFSLGGLQTWIGQASQEYVSFLTVATLVFLFYVLANSANETRVQTNILLALFLSASISGVLAVLGAFGVYVLPFDFAQTAGFNTVGTVNGLIEFLSIVMFAGLALWLVSPEGQSSLIPAGPKGLLMRVLIVTTTICALALAVSVDFWVFWALNIFGVIMVTVFHFLQTKAFPHPGRIVLPIVILMASIAFLFLPSPLRLPLPAVVSPGYQLSWQVAQSALSQGTSSVLFGSGPGTYGFDYAKYKPSEVNQSVFWNVRFDRAKSQAITEFANLGVVGFAAWTLLVLVLLFGALSQLLKSNVGEEWRMTYVFFIAWSVSLCAQLVYSSNMTLQFLFWGLMGLLASQVLTKVRTSDFRTAPRLALGFTFLFVLVGVGIIASVFVSGQRYASEIAFAQAVKLDRAGAPTEEVIEKLSSATSGYLGSQSDVYYRNFSSALLVQARNMLASLDAETTTDAQLQEVQAYVASAINASVRATELGPNEVSNWVVRGSIYRDVMSFVTNAEDFAAATFEQAILLEPVNPAHHTNLGRVHLAVAERARTLRTSENAELAEAAVGAEASELEAAEKAFNDAIALKPDYAPAHFYLAATFERQGRLEEATTRMAALRNLNPADVGLAFQLSLLLLRMQEYDVARQELERIVSLAPEYSNALWFLASAYEIQGDQQKAIESVQRVLELNPGNTVVEQRLTRMRNGEITTLLPGDLQQPIEAGEEPTVDVPDGEVIEEGDAVEGEAPADDAAPAEGF